MSKIELKIEHLNPVIIELYPEKAPKTVENFLKLINQNFYDGLIFHRVIRGFMIQGGCPEGTGMGGPSERIIGEFEQNGIPNDLKHTKGVISMARSRDNNSAGSQFFICHEDAPHLDGAYAAFGKVISGMESVDEVACTQTDFRDKPVEDVVIEYIKVIEE